MFVRDAWKASIFLRESILQWSIEDPQLIAVSQEYLDYKLLTLAAEIHSRASCLGMIAAMLRYNTAIFINN